MRRRIYGQLLLGMLLSVFPWVSQAQDAPKPDSCQEQMKTLQALQARISTQYDQLTADQIFLAFQPPLQDPMAQLNHILSQVRIINTQAKRETARAQQESSNFSIVIEQARQAEVDKKRLQEEVEGLRTGLTTAQAEVAKLKKELEGARSEKGQTSEVKP